MTPRMEPLSTTLSPEDERPRRGALPTRPHLYLAMECDRPLAASARYRLDVEEVAIGRGGERTVELSTVGSARRLDVRVPDRWMSSAHARLSKVMNRWVVEDAGSKNGTLVNGSPTAKHVLSDGDLLELGHTFFLYRDAVPTETGDPLVFDATQLRPEAPGLLTLSPSLARQFAQLAQVARSTVSILVRGDTGTGKEVVARAVHALSGRAGALVAMNCGALPETLIETELFGYRKGAFSGAVEDRPGLVRAADRGTLLLDEVGDLPAPSQAAFLRVLQEREVTPVGATRPVKVDLRLVAATHRDLDALAAEERFRTDLLARLSGFTLLLPPLAERREDLGLLVAALLARMLGERAAQVRFTPEAARLLYQYRWPANVRELEKSLGTAVVLAADGAVGEEHLPPPLRTQTPQSTAPHMEPARAAEPEPPLTDEEQRHRDELDALLRAHGGNVSHVARACGKARMQVHRWIKRYALDLDSYRR